ncbi:transglutaminase family protein [Microvirga sp. GCM10011540]|uniref:transglutaminase-like domain-containing protein n=1 Tax=Microvirga sp. GCM10011540 TaxID=3317338 RepID=UPI00360705F2
MATISAPADLALQWRQRGAFIVTDATLDGTRQITVELKEDGPGALPEAHMVSPLDVQPIFVATTLPSYEQIGALYFQQNAGKDTVTPAVRQLADQIAQGRTGLQAAHAVYGWVAGHIRYLAVWLDPDSGLVAHSADEVIRNGYGDCKDHVVLTQALLAALEIRAEPALVNWDNRTRPLPLWSSAAFNHVMVYLPDYDVYLNPTNPFARFDALDIGLSNKLVVIANGKGEVRQTPASEASDTDTTFRPLLCSVPTV